MVQYMHDSSRGEFGLLNLCIEALAGSSKDILPTTAPSLFCHDMTALS